VVAERGRERDFVTAGVALESVSDNVQLLAAPVAESLKHFEHRGGRTAWARVRDRLSALSIEINTRVVRVTSPAARDRASTEDTGQHAAHRTHCWPGHDGEVCCGHAARVPTAYSAVVIPASGVVPSMRQRMVSRRLIEFPCCSMRSEGAHSQARPGSTPIVGSAFSHSQTLSPLCGQRDGLPYPCG